MLAHPVLYSIKITALVGYLAVRQTLLQRQIGMAQELLSDVVDTVQRMLVITRVFVDGDVRGDSVANAEQAVQRVPCVDLVQRVIGPLRVRLCWGQTVLCSPCVGNRDNAVR